MKTPIADFVKTYAAENGVRFHMPGHKGKSFLGCEPYDITEIDGADCLYTASGIIAESQKNAADLFGAAATYFSTEGSSQCIRAMVQVVAACKTNPWILAARNAHKSFLSALALTDTAVQWLWQEDTQSICACAVSAQQVEAALQKASEPPAAVYVTSPDYLGNMLPIAEIAAVCHRFGTVLLVDNAHGAYLHFLPQSQHPIALGADMCCDSAHKTLPVLTGGAYLHIAKQAPTYFCESAKQAMELYGSTSPSYLILTSLDLCNRYLGDVLPGRLNDLLCMIKHTKNTLTENGWQVLEGEPLKLTVCCDGISISKRLRGNGIECEYADNDFLVLMVSGETTQEDFNALVSAMGKAPASQHVPHVLPNVKPEPVLSVRKALFAEQEVVAVSEAVGRIAAAPLVSCPPAIPIVVSGERIDENVVQWFLQYGVHTVAVVKE